MKLIGFTKKLCYQCFILLLFWSINLDRSAAVEIDSYFLKGNEYYQQGEYKAAIEEYEKIVNIGYESWEVYYNLGNAYFKDRQIGRAILNFERAKRLNPKNEDINFNLELANLSVVDRIPQMPQFFLFAWSSKVVHLFSLYTLGVITIAIYLLWIMTILLHIFLKSGRIRRYTTVSVGIASILFVIFTGLFSARIYENETKIEGIVVTDKVDVRSAPHEAGTEVFTLHQGVKVEIKDRSGEWAKIRLSDGKVGWLRQEVIEKI
ncbi:MAG: tetratricopeptide repeat protein [bacterium]